MARPSPSNPLGFVLTRQINDKVNYCKRLVSSRFEKSENLYRKDLLSHYGCVNAIEFSKQGDLIVSGGDDRRVLLWKVAQALQGVEKPVAMRAQHSSNIFCLGYDNSNTKIFSAGNDDQVIVHDLKTGDPLYYFLHEKPVYGLSVHPENDNLFSSACDDGRVLIYDVRNPLGTELLCLAQYKTPFHSVMYNPVEPRQLATANAEEGVSLWDIRKPLEPLLRYGVDGPIQSCMNVRFNSTGTRLLALKRRLPPVLYDLNSPEPLCHFDQPGYYNSCTMKSCCFAGDDESYILSGSDDFSLYMWKIPSENVKWVESAHMVLRGHRSIVNHVRYNPRFCILASSGVEKMIKIWSPFTLGQECYGGLTTTGGRFEKQRRVYTHDEYIRLVLRSNTSQFMTHDYSHQSTREDPRMMAFFDSLVQREIEGWSSNNVSTTRQSPSDSEDGHADPSQYSDSDSNGSTPSVTQLVQIVIQSDRNPRRQYRGGVAPERPFGPPNRISQLVGSCRMKLMCLAAMEGGNQVNPSATSTKQSPVQSDNGKSSSDEANLSRQSKLKSKARANALKRKKLRLLAQRSKARRKCTVLKISSDSESDVECHSENNRNGVEANEIPVVDSAQPSTSTGVRSGVSRLLSRKISPYINPKKTNHSSTSSDEDAIPIKRRFLMYDKGTRGSSKKPERCKDSHNKNKEVSEKPNNINHQTNGLSFENSNNLQNVSTSTPLKRESTSLVPPTPDSGVASSVSTAGQFDTTPETSCNITESSDCERTLKKSMECFKKKVDAARKGYRKRSTP